MEFHAFDRMAAMTVDDKIARMVDQIVKAAQPDQIILFGSRASGSPRSDSDVDFLVVMPLTKPRRRLEGDLHAALADADLAKDIMVVTPEELVRFRNVPGTIVQPAVATGKVVYRRAA
jgi:predicted nucleotidyltransferase